MDADSLKRAMRPALGERREVKMEPKGRRPVREEANHDLYVTVIKS